MPDTSRSRVHLRETRPRRANIGGYLSLLQPWARFRFPFLLHRVNYPYTFPLIILCRTIQQGIMDYHPLLKIYGFYWTNGRKKMWENRHQYLPTREQIIVLELVCVPEYMPRFRIHGKPYLLTSEERQQQICVGRERREPLNPRG
ncbi:hypothetical protein Gotur_031913 [Gossypium turneri]